MRIENASPKQTVRLSHLTLSEHATQKSWSEPLFIDFEVTQDDLRKMYAYFNSHIKEYSLYPESTRANIFILRNEFQGMKETHINNIDEMTVEMVGLFGCGDSENSRRAAQRLLERAASYREHGEEVLRCFAKIKLLDKSLLEQNKQVLKDKWNAIYAEYQGFNARGLYRYMLPMLLHTKIAFPERFGTLPVDSSFHEGMHHIFSYLRAQNVWDAFSYLASCAHLLRAYRIDRNETGLVVEFDPPFETEKQSSLPVLRAF